MIIKKIYSITKKDKKFSFFILVPLLLLVGLKADVKVIFRGIAPPSQSMSPESASWTQFEPNFRIWETWTVSTF